MIIEFIWSGSFARVYVIIIVRFIQAFVVINPFPQIFIFPMHNTYLSISIAYVNICGFFHLQ